MNTLIWFGIIFCISQSAMFSGLNLAFFSISKLRLEIESKKDNPHALKVARLRQASNFLLTTILGGNVGINVLLTLLSNSVMAGAAAFIFSTFIITFLGEIIPQAYFSRHALKAASLLLVAGVIYSAYYSYKRYGLLSHPKSIDGLMLDSEGAWSLRLYSGAWPAAQRPQGTYHPFCIVAFF